MVLLGCTGPGNDHIDNGDVHCDPDDPESIYIYIYGNGKANPCNKILSGYNGNNDWFDEWLKLACIHLQVSQLGCDAAVICEVAACKGVCQV